MADAESLKSFLIDVGFVVNEGQQRRMQESLVNVEKNVNRFSQATQKSTGFLNQFFAFFQKSEGPMRQHTETTDKLTKSFEIFSRSLKSFAEVVAAGAITKGFFDLNSQLEKLHYTAMEAGTTVRKLMSAQFAGPQAGPSVEAITRSLVGLKQALSEPGTAQIISQMLNIPLDRIIDPMTHKLRDMTDVLNIVLPGLTNLYKQGEVGVAIAKRIAEIANIDWQGLQLLIANPAQTQAYIEWQKIFDNMADRMGLSEQRLKEISDASTVLEQQLRLLIAALEVLAIKFVAPWIGPVTNAIKWMQTELGVLSDELEKLSKETGGVSDYVVGLGGAFFGAVAGVTALRVALALLLSPLRAISAAGAGVIGILSGIAGLAVRAVPVLGPAAAMIMDPRPLNLGEPQLKGPTGPGELAPKDWAGVWQAIKERFGYGGTMPVTPPGVVQLPDVNVQAPHYQQGGIVPATGPAIVHAGEGVLTANAMTGLARLGPVMEDLWDGFRSWWYGGGSFHPAVVVTNFDDMIQALREEPREDGSGYPGNAGGVGPRGRFAIGAPRAPRPPELGTTGGPLGSSSSPGAEYKFGAFNVGNIGAGRGRQNPAFGSMDEGIQAIAQLLSGYISRGYDTLNKIINRYSPSSENATSELIAAAAKRMRVDPNQRLGAGNMRDLVTATILNEWGGRFPAGYNQAIVDKALGAAPLGTTNSYRAGDKTVTLNAQANFNISGTDALSVGGAVNSVQSRTNADLIRNLSPIVQ